MAEPKIVVGIPHFIKGDPRFPNSDRFRVTIHLDNCDVADARMFMEVKDMDGNNRGTVDMGKLKRDNELSLEEGRYKFYLFCGKNLDEIRGERSERFVKVKDHCENPQNKCKIVTETTAMIPPPSSPPTDLHSSGIRHAQGGRRSKHRRSKHRRSGGRRHRKSHRRR